MEENDLLNIKDDDYMDKIVNDIDNLNKDNKFHQLFTDEEDRIKLRKGYIEEGIEQGKLEDAKKMLEENFPIETIMRITGLTRKQIESI